MTIPAEDLEPQHKPYRRYGAIKQLFPARDSEILVSGPAGTGKSRGVLEKIHRCCQKYDGCRWLILRKTRESLTESALVTFEEKVVEIGSPLHDGASRRMRQSYVYPNGSSIVVGGLDKPGKVMSTEYDGAYVQEAIEVTENDWEMVTTRLRNGKMPYQQMIGDTNPDTPRHWLKLREAAGRLRVIESRHEDNPTLWDGASKEWTEAGKVYLSKLDALTGARLQRLRYGRWVQSEGVVYEGWDRAIHLVDAFPDGRRIPPPTWPIYLAIDFGFTEPFVCQWWAMDPDKRLYLYREIVRTKRLVEDHARQIKAILGTGDRPPTSIICDHDREGRETLERYLGMSTRPARKAYAKDVTIQELASRLVRAGDGLPRLFVLRDAVVERDLEMAEAKRPIGFAEEIDGYVWNIDAKSPLKRENPIEENDHSMDAARYLCAEFMTGMGFKAPPEVNMPRKDIISRGNDYAGLDAMQKRLEDKGSDGMARRHLFGR